MSQFSPRVISKSMEAQGYNNEGRGSLIGYIAVPKEHEETCAYRKNPTDHDAKPIKYGDTCTCRIGLWQITMPVKINMLAMG